MLTHDDYEWVADVVKRAAVTVARKWPGIEREDIEQEIWVGILPSFETLKPDEDYVFKAATLHGHNYASRERYYYTFKTARWVYTPNEVRGLFKEAFFDPTQWEEMPTKEAENSLRAGGVVVSLWDLREVFEGLKPSYRAALERVYRDGEVADSALRKTCQRAVDTATRALNGRTGTVGDGYELGE